MAISTKTLDATGNQINVDGVSVAWDAMTNAVITSTSRPSISSGTGAPTFTAAQGSMYIRIDGGVNTRVYINTTGATTWTPLTNAA